MVTKLDYKGIKEYAEKLALQRNISIHKALKETIKYKRWKEKRKRK